MKKKILVIPTYYQVRVYAVTPEEERLFGRAYLGAGGLLEEGNIFPSIGVLFDTMEAIDFDDSVVYDEDLREFFEAREPDALRDYVPHQTLYDYDKNE